MEVTATIPQDRLSERSKNGNTKAFDILYHQYARAMYNTCLRIVNNTADAEDILQESFLDAFRFRENFENRSTFGAWLKKIVINKSINKIQREKFRFVEIETAGIHTIEEEEKMDEADFEYRIEDIKQAIKKLPDGYRTVLCLHLLEGYKHDEISHFLGISHSTVRTQFTRAKKKLLELITLNQRS